MGTPLLLLGCRQLRLGVAMAGCLMLGTDYPWPPAPHTGLTAALLQQLLLVPRPLSFWTKLGSSGGVVMVLLGVVAARLGSR